MKKNVMLAIVTAILFFIALICALVCRSEGVEREDLVPVVVTVGYGDTAWDIAKRYVPDGVDIREYITWVEDESGVDFGKPIYPGMRITFLKEAE